MDNRKIDKLTYPSRGTLDRLLYKTPLVLWRMGYGFYFGHPSRGGRRMLVLTSRGRVSGHPRHTMLSHVEAVGKDYVCSGWKSRSDWVKNIQKEPLVTVQSWRKSYSALARQVTDLSEFTQVAEEMFRNGGDSHFKPWLETFGIEFSVEDMIAKRERLLIFGFDEVDQEGPEPLAADLVWVHGILIPLAGMIWWLITR